MTNKKSTKKALIFSVLSLVLCLTMLVGTTFAWFTDSVTSGRNVIVAGNLDVVLEYKTNYEDEWKVVDENTVLFNEEALWEPGYTEVVFLRVSNAGTLALKYNLSVDVYNETPSTNVLGNEFYLSQYIKTGAYTQDEYAYGANYADILMPVMFGTREATLKNVGGNLTAFDGKMLWNQDAPVLPGDKTAQVTALVISLPETVGNEANYDKAAGFAAPTIEFGINLVATQYVDESDSFGNDYDKTADYVAYYTEGEHELNASLTATTATDVITASGAGTVVNVTGGFYDVGSKDCAVWAKDGATVNISGGTFICDGRGTPATSANHQDMIYAGTAGIINISGGFFSARSEGAWLLNEKDNSGILTVTGGTFVNWDPANNVSEGADTSFVADGYASIAHYKANGDIWYEVVKSSNKTGVVVEEGVSVDFEAETLEGKVTNKGVLSVTGGTLTAATAGVVNNGTATLTDVTMKAGSTADYSNITSGADAETTYNNVDIVSAGGGIGATDGAQVTVNGGSVAVNTKSTSGRYNFYAVGEGTVITINGGEYSFSKSYNQKRAYIYAGEGATVYVTGGTFGAASTRTGYTAGILGDGEVIITGGTFGFDPSAWVAEGYQAVKTGDVWVVSAI